VVISLAFREAAWYKRESYCFIPSPHISTSSHSTFANSPLPDHNSSPLKLADRHAVLIPIYPLHKQANRHYSTDRLHLRTSSRDHLHSSSMSSADTTGSSMSSRTPSSQVDADSQGLSPDSSPMTNVGIAAELKALVCQNLDLEGLRSVRLTNRAWYAEATRQIMTNGGLTLRDFDPNDPNYSHRIPKEVSLGQSPRSDWVKKVFKFLNQLVNS